MILNLYVWNEDLSEKVPAIVSPATTEDLRATTDWQTRWTSKTAKAMPNKVALRNNGSNELLGLMSYELDNDGLAVEVIYMESAAHSNANLLHQTGDRKKYVGIARALFAYAASISMDAGFGGVLYFKAKTSELRAYYIEEFGALPLGSYDPFRLAIWEDAAEELISDYIKE